MVFEFGEYESVSVTRSYNILRTKARDESNCYLNRLYTVLPLNYKFVT
jgi:hypothetical protein